jgi:hypothetical protein
MTERKDEKKEERQEEGNEQEPSFGESKVERES